MLLVLHVQVINTIANIILFLFFGTRSNKTGISFLSEKHGQHTCIHAQIGEYLLLFFCPLAWDIKHIKLWSIIKALYFESSHLQ